MAAVSCIEQICMRGSCPAAVHHAVALTAETGRGLTAETLTAETLTAETLTAETGRGGGAAARCAMLLGPLLSCSLQ